MTIKYVPIFTNHLICSSNQYVDILDICKLEKMYWYIMATKVCLNWFLIDIKLMISKWINIVLTFTQTRTIMLLCLPALAVFQESFSLVFIFCNWSSYTYPLRSTSYNAFFILTKSSSWLGRIGTFELDNGLLCKYFIKVVRSLGSEPLKQGLASMPTSVTRDLKKHN